MLRLACVLALCMRAAVQEHMCCCTTANHPHMVLTTWITELPAVISMRLGLTTTSSYAPLSASQKILAFLNTHTVDPFLQHNQAK